MACLPHVRDLIGLERGHHEFLIQSDFQITVPCGNQIIKAEVTVPNASRKLANITGVWVMRFFAGHCVCMCDN